MRGILIFAIVSFLLISGCSTEQPKPSMQEQVVEPVVIEQELVKEPNNITVPKSVVEEKKMVLQKSIDPAVATLLNKTKKVTSYKYAFYGPPNDAFGINFVINNEKIKIVLPKETKFADGQYYDTVYMTVGSASGNAYCENPDCINKDQPLPVSFSDYYKPTPFDFVETIVVAKPAGTEIVENRKATIISFVDNESKNGTMWLDNTFGLPVRVKFKDSKYEYRDFYFNSLTDKDVLRK
jgi:uncharacterized protein YcfL